MPGPYVDETLTCVECSQEFTFTVSEQEAHEKLGYQNKPKRCAPCRAEKKRRHAPQGAPVQREYHEAVCGKCGQTARVPFKPRGDRPVYCSSCFTPGSR